MSIDRANINWNYRGKTDFLLGTGATSAERILGWIASLIGVGLYLFFYLTGAFQWTWWQYLLAGAIAFDVVGGVVANSLNSCKRFYHSATRPDEPRYTVAFKNHLVFSALHLHPLLVAILYAEGHLFYGMFWYAFLLLSTVLVLKTPFYLKRPMAFLAIVVALLTNLYLVSPIRGFEWLIPLLMIKIVYGHLVPEEPYRPLSETVNAD